MKCKNLFFFLLTVDTIKQTITPLIKQLCTASMKSSDMTFSVIAKLYGMLLNNLQNHVAPVEGQWFLTFFMQLSKKGLSMSPEELDIDPGLVRLYFASTTNTETKNFLCRMWRVGNTAPTIYRQSRCSSSARFPVTRAPGTRSSKVWPPIRVI